jgi:hypothetical protein
MPNTKDVSSASVWQDMVEQQGYCVKVLSLPVLAHNVCRVATDLEGVEDGEHLV